MKLNKILPAVFVLIVIGLFVWYSKANATTPKPPKPTPPVTYTVEQQQRMDQHQDQSQDQTAHGGFGEGGDSYSDVRVETGDVASSSIADGGSSDNAVAISNVYMSRAFAQDFPITHGCFQGINAGHDETRATKSTGSFLGFTFLNNSCHMQTLASAERDVEIVARLTVW